MISKGSLRYFNTQLLLAVLLIAVSTFNYGFDNQAFATTQAMDPFAKQFGKFNPKTKKYAIETYWLSLFNSLNYIGFGAGVILGSLISARFGRRMSMFTMSCWALVTATITITAQRREQILMGRILNYIYVGMELAVVPVYQSEIVPTQVRGLVVGTYQFSLILGGIVINSICRGTSELHDNRAFRIPFGCFYIVPSIVLSLIWFIPESPRWLLTRGRIDEARTALIKLRTGTLSSEEIEKEFVAAQFTLEHEVEKGKFKELWEGINLKRTLIVIGVNFFQQATGQAFASQYGAIFIKSLGTVNPFTMTLVNGAVNSFALVLSLTLVDRIGRRPLLIAGAIVQIFGLFAMGALGTVNKPTIEVRTAIVAMLSIFAFGFSLGWAPLTYVVTTELPSLHLRDQSQRVASLVNVVTAFVVSFTLPYLLNEPYGGLHSKVGFIYGSMAVCTLIFSFFCIPECMGKSLEEVDLMFQEHVPLRQFKTYKAAVRLDNVIRGVESDSEVVHVTADEKSSV